MYWMAINCFTIEVQQEVRNATDSEFRTTMMANNAPDAQVAACKQSCKKSHVASKLCSHCLFQNGTRLEQPVVTTCHKLDGTNRFVTRFFRKYLVQSCYANTVTIMCSQLCANLVQQVCIGVVVVRTTWNKSETVMI